VIGLAGYKTISLALLIVLVALAGVSPVFAPYLIFTPPAACPGERVFFNQPFRDDVVGGGISVAAVSPLVTIQFVLSSTPGGLIATQSGQSAECQLDKGICTFVVSQSASCGRYTVTYTEESNFGLSVSGIFDVPSTCCPAVGGCVQPVNTFALVSPWLLAIGLIGCIGTVVVVAKKRRP